MSQVLAATPQTAFVPPVPQPIRLSHPPPKPAPVNTGDLLKNLASMGFLGNPTNGIATPSSTPERIADKSQDVFGPFSFDSKDLQMCVLEFSVYNLISKSFLLTPTFLFCRSLHHLQPTKINLYFRPRAGAVELLYSNLPLQCKQCGFRYPKTDEGQAKMDAHLDSHFRQNRRMKERVKRGLSRSWFVTESEWISGAGGEVTSQQAPAFLNDQSSGHLNNNEKSSGVHGSTEDANMAEDHKVVMPNDGRKPCPICGERFIDFWNDEEEEWMYKNAVLVENTVNTLNIIIISIVIIITGVAVAVAVAVTVVTALIYHATCHADAIKSGTLVFGDSSMDITPQEQEIDNVNNIPSSLKRKAEEGDVEMDHKVARTN
ncbi:hypothetical protein PHYBLDRAFT_163720 [Phycomyces blakesleeanus NRRL 1555(-)]|uniref:PCFS4-like zinc finger domain-containing protein n=1 Tax=Phycomyces blakesleeanus (strain ATCC 8743b / DSM 1359 / FGSC 10004 / NBRC 33097 / NRRL 1555) TaxID=763407 RepID=A0A163B787_PHYB8|nr:hypothetical protein PHYBLDRAFT_163720 [Phycomyces blakesleeanus NRRL 1555(-)]OAD78621.1 hypothetical protein PHYBLDRAFT_163720 [Phycomyces blakesleeanus NRRL 1555(-)]|eukprot:XP_018296661.1 hypothetical protein PHYBLDRAFT_163720 [Phycomyces blakesleeanus NRRL 1555(-)]